MKLKQTQVLPHTQRRRSKSFLFFSNTMQHQDQMNMKVNYHIHVGTDEAYAKMLEKTQKMPRIWFLYKNGILTKKARQLVTEMTRQLGWNMHNIRSRSGHNLVPLLLRNALANKIAGNVVTPTFAANYIALWDSATPPTIHDTTLGNEVLRGEFTNRFAIANIAFLDKFWSSTEVGGATYLEAWIFVDGTASADTWDLLSKIAINEAIGLKETLTINASITIG